MFVRRIKRANGQVSIVLVEGYREKVIAAHKAYFQNQVQVPDACYQEPEHDEKITAEELI